MYAAVVYILLGSLVHKHILYKLVIPVDVQFYSLKLSGKCREVKYTIVLSEL